MNSMEIVLKKIKQLYFDELIEKVTENYLTKGVIVIENEVLESYSEKLTYGNNDIVCNIDINNYKNIVCTKDHNYIKMAKVGMQLHKDLKLMDGGDIPHTILYQKEVWAYLSLGIFKEIVEELRNLNGDKIENKIKKIYFNCGQISRTCLFFAWCMIDRLGSENDSDISLTAFEFVDPVKAIFERTLSRSPKLLRAYVQGIINNKKDSKFKRDPFRKSVPNNISCYAAVNMLESLEYENLVSVISEQQKSIIS